MTGGPSLSRADATTGSLYGVAYYRVSTSRQANTTFDEDGFSIQAQRDYCQRKAADMGVQLVDEYIDRGKSARTAGRPALQAMLARIKEDTDIQFVFVHKLDRLARNRADDVHIGLLLAKNGVRLVSCTENIDDSPSGRLVHGIMGDIAEWYSANLSEEAKKGMRKKVELGGTPGLAPLGYVNTRLKITALGKDIGTVTVHERYGPIITECFKLYDTGRCSLAEVATHANNQGLHLAATKRLPERSLRTQHLQRILRNRYYTGWLRYNGVEYRGTHPPLIDEATFTRVQALLTARNLNKDKGRKRPHHLKGFLFCARCGRRFGITVRSKPHSRRTYAYFYCLGRQVDPSRCPQGHIPLGDIEDAVRAYWANIHIPAERIRVLRQAILADFTGKHDQGKAEIERQKRRIIELEQRRQKAKAAYYANALELDDFKAEQEAIRQGIQAAEATIARWSVELESIREALDTVCALVESPQALYDALPEGLKVLLMQAIFEKLWVLDMSIVGSELTETFADLLCLDARLALVEQRQQTRDGTADANKDASYYRTRESVSMLLRGWSSSWARPYVERPQGPLPVDKQSPGQRKAQGSNMQHLVHLMRHKSNSDLVAWMRANPYLEEGWEKPKEPIVYRATPKKLHDRLSDQKIDELVTAFQTGVAKHVLAERYGNNIKSVKKLLRERGVKRKSRWDRAA